MWSRQMKPCEGERRETGLVGEEREEERTENAHLHRDSHRDDLEDVAEVNGLVRVVGAVKRRSGQTRI
jgi:hypothetical protein